MIGETLGNHRIISKLGQGGMGTVYEAEDSHLGRRVAIKLLNPTLVANPKELARFQSEAKVQARLNHPNVVTLHEFEPFKDSYYMVMEYVVGRNLADIVRVVGALPPHIVVTLSKQVLDGLSAAHRIGVVHRDLKPSNIMLTPDGVAKVMDFGIAKVQGAQNLTATGALVGTVYYMSPEQVRGEAVDARSDIYSFGIILFELLTGRVPFKEESDFSVMMHHVRTPAPPPTQFLPEVPGALEDIVLRCLQKDPAARFQHIEEILGSLDSFEEQERALGRGQLYSRKTLSQWLATAANRAMTGQGQEVPAIPQQRGSAALATTVTTSLPGSRPDSNNPPQPVATPKRQGGVLLVLAILFAVLVFGGIAYMLAKGGQSVLAFWKKTSKVNVSQAQVGGASKAQTSASVPGPATPPASSAPPNPPPTSSSAPPPSSPPAGSVPIQSQAGIPSSQGSSDLAVSSTVRKNAASGARPSVVATSVEARSPGSSAVNARPQAAVSNGPQGFLIFMDLDQSGEKLPLGSANATAAEVLRTAGREVVSLGVVGAGVRNALDRGDLAQVRRSGVGYVVMGTAHGALESQNAYGSTYYVGKVKVSLELVRMSDGKVAATGASNAKSRGTANAEAALTDALLAATSDATREMLRNFEH